MQIVDSRNARVDDSCQPSSVNRERFRETMASEIIDCVGYIVRKVFWSLSVVLLFLGKRFLDLIGLLFFVLACLTVIRLPCMLRQIFHLTLRSWRYVGFVQFLIFIMDIPIILMFAVMIICSGGLILIPVYKEIKSRPTKYHCDYSYRNSSGLYFGGFPLRYLVIRYFSRFVVDVLLIPAVMCLAVSWRLPKLLEIFRTTEFKKWKLRGKIVKQFFRLLADILTLPFLVFVAISWRCPLLVLYLLGQDNLCEKSSTISKAELFVILQFILLPLDCIQLVCSLFVFCTWRSVIFARQSIHILRPQKSTEQTIIQSAASTNNQNAQNLYAQETRTQKFSEKSRRLHEIEYEIKKLTFSQVGKVLIDLPFVFLFIVIILLPLRLPFFVYKLKNMTEKTSSKLRFLIAAEFLMLIVSLFTAVCLIGCIVAFWRVKTLFRQKKKKCDSFDSNCFNWSYEQELKLYKIVALNFLMIFVDILATVLLIILLVTIWRIPKVLLQLKDCSGGKSFSAIVLVQFAQLCVDIVFAIIFLILIILRPVTSWVVLLEDTKHRNNRILVHYLNWVPDVVSDLESFKQEISDYVSVAVKSAELAWDPWKIGEFQKFLNQMCFRSCKRLRWLIEKTKDNEGFQHRLQLLQFAHQQLPLKISALLVIELEFLKNRDTYLRKKNIAAFLKDAAELDEKSSQIVKDVKNFQVPKLPLYEDQCGLTLRTRKETQKVLLDALPKGGFPLIMLAILEVLLLFRAPELFRRLKRQPYAWREIILRCALEYLRDLLALLQFILIAATLVYLPEMTSDVYFALFYQRSWKVARLNIARYPPILIVRLGHVLKNVLSFKIVTFVSASLLLTLLGPADVLLTTTAFVLPSDWKCLRYLISAVFHVSLSTVPFFIHFYFKNLLPEWATSLAILSYMLLVIFIVFLFLVVIFIKSEYKSGFKAPVPGIVIWSWSNVSFIIHDFIDLAQDLALLLVTSAKSLQYGSYVKDISDIFLFNFIPPNSKLIVYPVVFTWCMFFVTPTVLENIMEAVPVGTVTLNPFWKIIAFFLSRTLFLSITEFLVSTLACVENENVNTTNVTWILAENEDVECWEGVQKWTGSFSLYLFFYYFTTAILFTAQSSKIRTCNNIQYSPLYELLLNFVKVALVLTVLYSDFYKEIVSTNVILCVIMCVSIIMTCLFKQIFGFPVSTYQFGLFWKISSLLFLFLVSCLLVASKEAADIEENFCFMLASLLTVLLLANVVASVKLKKKTVMEINRQKFVDEILELEKSKRQSGGMISSWNSKSANWRRLVKNCRLSGVETFALPPSYDYLEADSPIENPDTSTKVQVSTVIALDSHAKTLEWNSNDNQENIDAQGDAIQGILLESSIDNPTTSVSSSSRDQRTLRSADTTRRPRNVMYVEFIEKKFNYQEEKKQTKLRSYFNQRRSKIRFPFELLNDFTDLEYIGSNLLLAFEANLRFECYSVEGINCALEWRERLCKSDWADLVARVEDLKNFLEGTYDQPQRRNLLNDFGTDETDGSFSLFTYTSCAFKTEDTPPKPLMTPEEQKAVSAECMSQLLRFVSDIVKSEAQQGILLETLDKVLPSADSNVFVSAIEFTESRFRISFNQKKASGTIQKVGPQGVAAAVGAKIVFCEYLTGKIQEFEDGSVLLRFVAENERPTVQKLMFSLEIKEIKLFYKTEKADWCFEVAGRSKKTNSVIDTLFRVKWS